MTKLALSAASALTLTFALTVAVNAWAIDEMPSLAAGQMPKVGEIYTYTTAYPAAHIKDCPAATCVGVFRGKLPSSAAKTPASPRTGGIFCPSCERGIYLADDSHYAFVY